MATVEHERSETNHMAKLEAVSIVKAMKNGIDMTDAMIISKPIQRALALFCKQFPNDAYMVQNALRYRRWVRQYVDRILAGEDLHVSPEAEEEADIAEGADSETADPVQGEAESAAQEAQA
jgi:hypothetical protein